MTSGTQDVALHQTVPISATIAADPAETALRELYFHAAGTVRLGMIASADGKATGPDGSSRSLNGPEDLRILRTLRSVADVVLVGGNTARSERYADIRLPRALSDARAALGMPETPDLAVVTYSGSIPQGLSPERTWIVTTQDSPAARSPEEPWRSRVITAGELSLDPQLLVDALTHKGLGAVLCEGGPALAQLMLARAVVSDFCLTRSPELGGGDSPRVPGIPPDMTLKHRLEGGNFVMERWVV